MPTARLALSTDLPSLLALFASCELSRAVEPREQAERVWQETLAQPGLYVFVSDSQERIAATCMLITAPNLLRGGRRHGILENVATHPELQGRGHGRAVVQAALARAWTDDCHHVLMQSGRKDPRVHVFYGRLGFVPALRTAYVADRPPPSHEESPLPQAARPFSCRPITDRNGLVTLSGELRHERIAAKVAPTDALQTDGHPVATEPVKGPASYFPSIEKKYGRPVGEWQQIVRNRLPAKHMDLVSMLKAEHGMGHGHANAIVAYVLSAGEP